MPGIKKFRILKFEFLTELFQLGFWNYSTSLNRYNLCNKLIICVLWLPITNPTWPAEKYLTNKIKKVKAPKKNFVKFHPRVLTLKTYKFLTSDFQQIYYFSIIIFRQHAVNFLTLRLNSICNFNNTYFSKKSLLFPLRVSVMQKNKIKIQSVQCNFFQIEITDCLNRKSYSIERSEKPLHACSSDWSCSIGSNIGSSRMTYSVCIVYHDTCDISMNVLHLCKWSLLSGC